MRAKSRNIRRQAGKFAWSSSCRANHARFTRFYIWAANQARSRYPVQLADISAQAEALAAEKVTHRLGKDQTILNVQKNGKNPQDF